MWTTDVPELVILIVETLVPQTEAVTSPAYTVILKK